MRKKISILINPISGTGKQAKALSALKEHLNATLFDAEMKESSKKGDITRLAKEAVISGADAVIVVGGDGTINEAIQALVGTKTALGIIPIGSGNALARHLKIPISIKKSIQRINLFKTKQVDTAQLNSHTFVSLAGIGFDAQVAKKFSLGKKRGLWNYIRITVREFFSSSEKEYDLVLDGENRRATAFMIVFANANQFGNNLVISPEGIIDDGFLDVCIVKKPKIYQLPTVFYL
ncbi:MAG: YegS/Rv2252/BmrU family lipid kinase, partial [Bacteroidales bacterium]|nr:YegS/Rv2252/BmrU family lipid kinase [Bacteroidales bacterium]